MIFKNIMGHYCHVCGEKLVGGVVPTTCDRSKGHRRVTVHDPYRYSSCVECYCCGCWDRLFVPKVKKRSEDLFTITPDGEVVPITDVPLYVKDRTTGDLLPVDLSAGQHIYLLEPADNVCCPDCKNPYFKDQVVPY